MADRLHLSRKHRRILEALLREHLPDVEVWAYGSRVNGRSHDGSDLDLVLRGPGLKEIPIGQLGDFWDAVSESSIPFLVEARDWARLPDRFRREIESQHLELCAPCSHPSCRWQKARLGDVIRLRRGHDLPKRLRVAGSFPVVSSSGISDSHAKAKVQGPGVIIGRYGTLGEVHFVRSDYWPLNTTLYVEDFKGNDPRYVSYLLETLDVSPFSDKAAVPGLNRNHLHEAEVPFASRPAEQRDIAHTLGTLDDKIELNRRMDETLAAAAQALFKSWFVDFQPVRAKIEQRDAELPAELEEIFPAALDGRGIPQGWPETRLTDIASFTRGTSYRSAELADSRVALLTLKSFERGGGYKPGGLKPYTGAYKPEQVLDTNELVVALTDVTQMAEVIGSPAIVPEDEDYDELVASLDVGILRPLNRNIGPPFLYDLLSTDRYRAHVRAHSTGTTVLHLGKHALPSYCLPLPTPAVLSAFNRIAEPLMARRRRLQGESRALARLRNVLLPKLISGELRVPDAERIAAAVT